MIQNQVDSPDAMFPSGVNILCDHLNSDLIEILFHQTQHHFLRNPAYEQMRKEANEKIHNFWYNAAKLNPIT